MTHPLNNMKFSAPDNDNDLNRGNCAASVNAGLWYTSCAHIHPNRQPPYVYLNSNSYDLLSIEMKIRQHDCYIVTTELTSVNLHVIECTIV